MPDEPAARVEGVTTLIVNYKTLDLTRRAVETFRARYPDLPLLLIDNGSRDGSTEYIVRLGNEDPNVAIVVNERNRYHGPAMDQGMKVCRTPFVFTLDSDCDVLRGGFLELMLALFEDERVYAVGDIRYKNRFGYTYGYDIDVQADRPRRIPYIHPYAMLVDRAKYAKLQPFIHHGAPCIKNMRDAKRVGFIVRDFPIDTYIEHRREGTSARHGYGPRARARQLAEYALSRAEGFVLRDPVLKVQHRTDTDEAA